MAQVDIGGYVQTDNRLFLQRNNSFYWNENRLDLKIETSPSDDARLFSNIWLRSVGLPEVSSSGDLMRRQKDAISPWGVLLREAYLELYGFLLPNLDLSIGLQRIAWGKADKLNPTDNLNPDDLEDIWDFGRHLGSNSVKASYYLDRYTATAVFIPVFTPAALPVREWAGALSPPMELPVGLALRNSHARVSMPSQTMGESSMFGFKLERTVWGYDLSLSYFYGRDDIPLVGGVAITSVDTAGTVDAVSELVYPRMQVVGFDIAGTLGEAGVWFEGAMVIPEKVEGTTDLRDAGMGIQISTVLDNRPYFKYVIGTDYSMGNGWYLNAQYLHGFIHERGGDALGDYIMFALEKKLLNDRMRLVPIGGGLEIRDIRDFRNNFAIVWTPEITYAPTDNVELYLGFRLVDGNDGTMFGSMRKNDEVSMRAKYSF